MINRGIMRGRHGRKVSSPNQEAFLPEISTQDPTPPEVHPEVISGITLHQFNLLLQQVQNLTTTVQNLQQTVARNAPVISHSVPPEHRRHSLSLAPSKPKVSGHYPRSKQPRHPTPRSTAESSSFPRIAPKNDQREFELAQRVDKTGRQLEALKVKSS